MLENLAIINSIEDQRSVDFTGKINLLSIKGQHLGELIFIDGEFVSSIYKESSGLKSFYNMLIDSYDQLDIKFIVEPEIIENPNRNIHFPYSILLKKAAQIIEKYQYSRKNRPPEGVMLRLNADFVSSDIEVTPEEYSLMTVLIDFHDVKSIYKNCGLLDYEITNALVGLRKKSALKVIATKK